MEESNGFSTVLSRAVEAVFFGSGDYTAMPLRLPGGQRVTVSWLEGLISSQLISDAVLRPLSALHVPTLRALEKQLLSGGVWCAGVEQSGDADAVARALTRGKCALFFGDTAILCDVKSPTGRSVSSSQQEKVLKGARDAFVESLRQNTALLRRKLRTPALCVEESVLGTVGHTRVAMVYLRDRAKPELAEELRRRLENYRGEAVLQPGILEEQLCDDPSSPFPQLISTERPDKLALNLLEGRVGLLIDGMPVSYLVPGTLSQLMKVPEDLSGHWLASSVLTSLRYLAMVLTLVLPGIYVAAVMYHQELIPTRLMQSIIQARQAVPFPTAVEVLGMLLAFELLQEAGVRLPDPAGQTMSIVGALVVGQSAVEARVVSPVVVIVVAIAGVCGYTMPNADMGAALRLWRFLLVLAAAAAGFYGLVTAGWVMVLRLCAMDSFSVGYLSPFTEGRGTGRALFRAPSGRFTPGEPELRQRGTR